MVALKEIDLVDSKFLRCEKARKLDMEKVSRKHFVIDLMIMAEAFFSIKTIGMGLLFLRSIVPK